MQPELYDTPQQADIEAELPQPVFRTPEQVSSEGTSDAPDANTTGSPVPSARRQGFLGFLRKPDLSKKQWIILGVSAVVMLSAGSVFGYKLIFKSRSAAPVAAKKAPAKVAEKPRPILSPLSGLEVSQEVRDRPVTGVMIENSPEARPQSGLDQASIVFEAIAEAGITRFLALYQDNYPTTLGPVRSSRPYYLDWVMAFDASYAHVGGSPDALQRIKDISVKDLDQFYNAGPYRRITTRFAPHNVYTSLQGLADRAAEKGWTKSSFTPLKRKAKEEPSKKPTARSIDFAISGPTYNVRYDYDPARNAYLRSMGGGPHTDNETKAQLAPKVVVALVIPYSLMADGYHSAYQTIGSGPMFVFQDGVVTQGTWSKGQPNEQFVFTDAAGKDLLLNPGQTWFTVLKDAGNVSYQP